MSRYKNADLLKDENGKRRIETWIIQNSPIDNTTDVFIEIINPERLDKLADQFYDDQSLWYIIAQANGLGKGSYIVPAGKILRIPDVSGMEDYIINVNETR